MYGNDRICGKPAECGRHTPFQPKDVHEVPKNFGLCRVSGYEVPENFSLQRVSGYEGPKKVRKHSLQVIQHNSGFKVCGLRFRI